MAGIFKKIIKYQYIILCYELGIRNAGWMGAAMHA
jgi:hypothetical protein